jgi:hypothetical protein
MKRSFLFTVVAAAPLVLCACGTGSPQARPTKTITVTASPSQPAVTQPAASPAAPTPQPPAAAPGCLTRYLNGSIGLTQGTAGSVMVTIVFKNLNNVPCTLYGFPGVAQGAGTPVNDVGQPSSENHATARQLVTLAPGGFANATLQIVDAGNFSPSACTQVPADYLVVIPPNQTVPLYISYSSTACQGSAQLLSVTPVQPGNGG